MANNLLKGKKGIIFGALDEKSIAWITALRCFEEGAQLVLTNAPVALRMGEINKLAEQVNAPVIPCDVSSNEDVDNLITKSMEHFGGSFDFVLHSTADCPRPLSQETCETAKAVIPETAKRLSGTQGPQSAARWPLGPGSRCARPG